MSKKDMAAILKTVQLRDYPYPYDAMLSICSDLDETPNLNVFYEISRFLNTDEDTPMGRGVNLEIGNTIYFDMPNNQFSYINTNNEGREVIHSMIRSGHIDCLHSFGDLVTTRKRAAECIDMLKKADCFIEVWIDHAQAPTNLDSDIMQGKGNIYGSNAYVADLLYDYGIRFVWKGRVTSIIAQNVKRRPRHIINYHNPWKSLQTYMKEQSKYMLACLGSQKYKIHKNNKILQECKLNGNNVYEFLRSNPSWGGVSAHDNAKEIWRVLTKTTLNNLLELRGATILYTHLGKIYNESTPFQAKTINAFKLLSDYYHKGKILVTTTRRLLRYQRAMKELTYSTELNDDTVIIRVSSDRVDDLSGMTWYVPDDFNVTVLINNLKTDVVVNPPVHSGRRSVSIPWKKLSFPKNINQ